MTNLLTSNFSVINLYKKSSSKSEIVTQMIYGDSFSIIKKTKNWLKIKIKDDGYKGYVQNKNFPKYFKPTHKIGILKANVYRFSNKRKKVMEIPFGSRIKVLNKHLSFLKFSKGWISTKDVKPITFTEKNLFNKIRIFKNIKYKWGGKSFKGIDCSGLIQIFLNYNNIFCPRDAKDQVRYFKKKIKLKNIKKNDIIFWKGHVALVLSKRKLIHAYGPMKKTVIMEINQTIKKIEESAKLKVIGIRRL